MLNKHLALAHGLPTHYSVGKYLSELLIRLTHNDYSLKDPFDEYRKDPFDDPCHEN